MPGMRLSTPVNVEANDRDDSVGRDEDADPYEEPEPTEAWSELPFLSFEPIPLLPPFIEAFPAPLMLPNLCISH